MIRRLLLVLALVLAGLGAVAAVSSPAAQACSSSDGWTNCDGGGSTGGGAAAPSASHGRGEQRWKRVGTRQPGTRSSTC